MADKSMPDLSRYSRDISDNGFTVIDNVFSDDEINNIITLIESAKKNAPNFRHSKDLFAIRQFFKEVPESINSIFTSTFKKIIDALFGEGYFSVKSIYFDKPAASNWFVAWHQDLTISVKEKFDMEGYGPWTVKQEQFSVQPPIKILENNFTVRIHLDDTNADNGALKVISQSHAKGICRPENIDWLKEKEISCSVNKGGIMVMKPLLMHSSGRTINNKQRRVIHIEFSNQQLAYPLLWSEKIN